MREAEGESNQNESGFSFLCFIGDTCMGIMRCTD
jgi:hypothetical protein